MESNGQEGTKWRAMGKRALTGEQWANGECTNEE